jgi:hypothetical protein
MTPAAHHDLALERATAERPQSAGTALWAEPEPGFWVAAREGDFLGTVTMEGMNYVARDATGSHAGAFGTLAAARASLAPLEPCKEPS